ncbi:MAG: hypothetical protein ACOCRX_03950 [Candidatus Woesearchaeota archaeon]
MMDKNIKNLTPHPVVLVDDNGNEIVSFPSQGSVRLESHTEKVGDMFINKSSGNTIQVDSGWSYRGGEAPPVNEVKCSECGADPGNGTGGYSFCCGAEEVDASFEKNDWIQIPLTKTVFGNIHGLPEYKTGIYYIVSSLVAQACPDRSDLLIPNESVRGEDGWIIGVKSLAVNPFLEGDKNE